MKRIQEESGAKIEIEDDGTVRVIAVNTESADIALARIKEITAEPEIGATYEGEVRSILPFGAFVQIMPGRDGLLHISEIATAASSAWKTSSRWATSSRSRCSRSTVTARFA